jgi:serine/threonine-protein kinase RsbT
MSPPPINTFEIRAPGDVVFVRQTAVAWATALGLSVTDRTKIATAASELARNTLQHGGGGRVTFEAIRTLSRSTLRLVFEDQGPGIPDIEQALTDGYSTAGGLGLGLGGARRLVNEFTIESQPGHGTRVVISRWR